MALLVITQSTRARWGIVLQEGVTRVGKAGDQDVRIDDPSVADTHCELLVAQGRVFVRDLGSGLDTLRDGTRVVGTTRMRNGQVLRLGKIEMRIEAEFSDLEPLTAIDPMLNQRRQRDEMSPNEPPKPLTPPTPLDPKGHRRTLDPGALARPAIEHPLSRPRRRCRALILLLWALALVAITLIAHQLMGAK